MKNLIETIAKLEHAKWTWKKPKMEPNEP